MSTRPVDRFVHDARPLGEELLSLVELARRAGMSTEALSEIVELGAIEPDVHVVEPCFNLHHVRLIRELVHWQREFDMSPPAIALLLTCLQRIDELRQRIHRLECMAPHLESKLTNR